MLLHRYFRSHALETLQTGSLLASRISRFNDSFEWLFVSVGKTTPEEIIRSVEKGLFVKKMGGGQVNTVNGDFVFEVSEGYLIEKGAIGEPVRGAILTGNGPQVLKEIDMVGDDLGFGIGTCGKDGQGVPVADAQPTLRIPEIVVGGGQ